MYSGAGVPLWTNRYNGPGNGEDYVTTVAVDSTGNVVVTGSSYASGSSGDYTTIKYSGAGLPLWTNRYNGESSGYDYANALAVDGSGNVFVTGHSLTGSSYDYATIKYSGAGVPLWTTRRWRTRVRARHCGPTDITGREILTTMLSLWRWTATEMCL